MVPNNEESLRERRPWDFFIQLKCRRKYSSASDSVIRDCNRNGNCCMLFHYKYIFSMDIGESKSKMITDNRVEVKEFSWEIRNFSKYCNGVTSQVFNLSENFQSQCKISLSFKYCGRLSSGIHHSVGSFRLHVESVPKRLSPSMKYKLNIYDTNYVLLETSYYELYHKLKSSKSIELWSKGEDFNCQENVARLFSTDLIDDTIVVECKFTIFNFDVKTVSIPSVFNGQGTSLQDLSMDLKNLYDSKNLVDFKICVGDDVLWAHKSILIARSPVFKRMIEHNYQESETNSIEIKDYNSKTFELFLKYLYSGDLEDASYNSVYRLYSLADKYDVPSLLRECRQVLENKITVAKACSILELSHHHNDADLKRVAVDFIASSFSAVKRKPKWVTIMKNYPELSVEIFALISDRFAGFPKN